MTPIRPFPGTLRPPNKQLNTHGAYCNLLFGNNPAAALTPVALIKTIETTYQ
jgi:hypothetical protein